MRFDGEISELKIRLGSLQQAGEWRAVNPNQFQFRAKNKGIMNWYPSTGNITFQGNTVSAEQLQALVEELLDSEAKIEKSKTKDALTEAESAVEKLSTETIETATYF